MVIEPNRGGDASAVTYSGPTYIALRSGKHSSSTAYSHALDFEKLTKLEIFRPFIKCAASDHVKPCVVVSVDGGPDENPRFQKTVATSVHHFKTFDLDCFILLCNAPKRSAFNRVEHRMSPLSNEMAGLILPHDHDHFGTHLDLSENTVDLSCA